MSTTTSRSTISRRKRRLVSSQVPLSGARLLVGFLGLLILGLLVSLGIIAYHLADTGAVDTGIAREDKAPINVDVSR